MVRGACTIIVGSNGAGKSTELSSLSQGRANDLSTIPHNRHSNAASFAFVRQAVDRLSISQRVSSFLETPLVLGGRSVASARAIVKHTLTQFGWDRLYDRDISSLSGGEDQLIHLLGGVVLGGEGLVVDDPFGMLDARRISEIQSVLQHYSSGTSVDDASRDLILAIPDSDVNLASQFAETSHDSLEVHLPKNASKEEAVTEFMITVSHAGIQPDSEDALVFENFQLHLKDKRVLVSNLSTQLMPGRVHLLTGENGAGKSLLLRAITGRLPTAAKIGKGRITSGECNGSKRSRKRYTKRSIVFVPQHCHRLLTTTEPWTVVTALSLARSDLVSISKRLLDMGVLWDDRPVTEASVGEVRFVTHLLAAISALVRPNVRWLLADEPDAYLDSFYQRSLAKVYAAIAASGKGVLVTSHRKNIYLDIGASEFRIS